LINLINLIITVGVMPMSVEHRSRRSFEPWQLLLRLAMLWNLIQSLLF